MLNDDEGMTLAQLSERSGLTPRTIRYYIAQGLLAPPAAAGPNTRYEQAHLERLVQIRQLQAKHLPLAEIRRLLSPQGGGRAPPVDGGALDYVRAALAASGVAPEPPEQAEARGFPLSRSQWERLVLADDVELHIRRPLSREMNRKVERLLEEARRLFEEG